MKAYEVVGCAFLAGLIGGVVGATGTRALQREPSVIRAQSFQLVDNSGKEISYWGIDNQQNAILAFAGHWPKEFAKEGSISKPGGLRTIENQRVAFGVLDEEGFVRLGARDGKRRLGLYVNEYGKPSLIMEDKTGPRLLLGLEQSDTPSPEDDDWSLAFFPERVRLGMQSEVRDGKRYVKGSFAVHNDWVKYP
jgi:hypothetical protein